MPLASRLSDIVVELSFSTTAVLLLFKSNVAVDESAAAAPELDETPVDDTSAPVDETPVLDIAEDDIAAPVDELVTLHTGPDHPAAHEHVNALSSS